MAELNAIQQMNKELNKLSAINQNGYNDNFYPVYDDMGRVIGSKEGIVTVPSEMTALHEKYKKTDAMKEAVAAAYPTEEVVVEEPVEQPTEPPIIPPTEEE